MSSDPLSRRGDIFRRFLWNIASLKSSNVNFRGFNSTNILLILKSHPEIYLACIALIASAALHQILIRFPDEIPCFNKSLNVYVWGNNLTRVKEVIPRASDYMFLK